MLGRRSIFLIGPMGSGKSAVGKTLARLLEVPFYDCDIEIERRTGVDIPYIFDKEGEAGFRLRESEALEVLTRLSPIVLATGGGAVLLEENRRMLVGRGCVVYLETSVAQQAHRVKHARHRPLLKNADPEVRLAQILEAREPLYLATADVKVSTDHRKVQAVAEEIIARLEAVRVDQDGSAPAV